MATTIGVGDIAVVAVQSDNAGGSLSREFFQFVLLKAVSAGTVIYFTDAGYRTDTGKWSAVAGGTEGVVRWTAQTDLPLGTILTYLGGASSSTASTTEWQHLDPTTGANIATNNISLSNTGDSIYAIVNPTFGGADNLGGTAVTAVAYGPQSAGGDGFDSPFTGGIAGTGLAPGLTDGVNALSLGRIGGAGGTLAVNGRYNENAAGSIEQGTAAQILASIMNEANWTKSVSGTPVAPNSGHTTGTFNVPTPTTLAAGDIAFSAYQGLGEGGSYNRDAFEFVLLVPVTAGTTIYFTDGGFQTTNSRFRTNEGLLRWVAQTDLAAGTIVTFLGNPSNPASIFTNTPEFTGLNPVDGSVVTTGTFNFISGGDSIHAFQDPVFGGAEALGGRAIAAIWVGGNQATFLSSYSSAGSNSDTALATGLTDGINALSIGLGAVNGDGTTNGNAAGRYNENTVGSTEIGTAAQVRAALFNEANWLTAPSLLERMFNPGGHAAGTFQVVNLTAATVGINDVAVLETDAGTTTLVFTVTRTNNTGAFTLDYATANGTATAGTDYVAANGTITFTVGGSLTATITVTINGERAFEPNETLFVNLTNISNPAAATFSDAQGQGTITNDDAAPNVAPVVDLNGAGAGTSTTLAYTENGAPAAIAPAGTVTDANSTTFNGGSLTIAFTANGTAADQLTIQNQGSGAGQIGVAGANVSFGGTVIGTFTGGTNGTALVITFNNVTATPAAVQALERAILFSNSSENPATLARTVTFTLVDGGGMANGGADTGSATATVTVTAVNDAPAGTNATLTINEDNPRTLTAADFGFSDVDGNSLLAVRITSLPALGTLTLSGSAVTAGDIVAAANLPNLVFTPVLNGNGNGHTSFTFQVQDNGGTANSGVDLDQSANTITFNVTPVDDLPVAVADPTNAVNENATLAIAVLANDTDVDAGPINVATINGAAATVGAAITLASGATATLNANGTITYNPNGRFNALVDATTALATGALNTSATDSFAYALNGGSAATATVTVNGVASAGDQLGGNAGNNTLNGTPLADTFNLSTGGDDTVNSGDGDDAFIFGAAFTAFDTVNGGAGTNDQVGLSGDYSGGLVLGANTLSNIEVLAVLPGSSYFLVSNDGNVAAGQTLSVFGGNLGGGNNFTFDGSAETNGMFRMYGGLGTDTFTGGALEDGFYFGPGKWDNLNDTVTGGGGTNDQLALDGDYTISIGANANVETLILLPGPGGSPNTFNITLTDVWTAAAATKTVWGLKVTTAMTINGSAETNGNLIFFGGQNSDTLTGGAGTDAIFGGGGGDTLTGGAGNDTFRYDAVTDSNGVTNATRDRILDFSPGDKIDLSRIDAITGGVDDAFSFIGAGAFTNVAGQLRYTDTGAGGIFIVEGDVNGDGVADFTLSVTMTPATPPLATDFIL